ncbi:MAG: YicC/YloC family endoribonuclease [Woeseiaceae bacterium]|nr:YicC/YloC family endoribonuclease [Woeseiaceae bacterium]
MTGFARRSVDCALGTLTWELRAVNHRYLDLQFKMPEELRPKEQAFRQQVGARLRRGKVECAFHFRRAFDEDSELQINEDLVGLLADRLRRVAKTLDDAEDVDPVDVLRWPGVIQQPEIDLEPLFDEASALLDEALEQIADMRASEGERIQTMIESRCDDIAGIAAAVRARMPEVMDAVRQKQRDRIDKLDVEADPDRLEVELALIASKLDVDEEIDRLESHVTEIRDTLNKDEAVGRRLDFLMQELNREANTLASKSADTETTRAAVDLKVLIEQMREQIQNVE